MEESEEEFVSTIEEPTSPKIDASAMTFGFCATCQVNALLCCRQFFANSIIQPSIETGEG
jgi:hypothetical protein